MVEQLGEQDAQFIRRTLLLVVGWTTVFALTALGLVFYGDVLMDLFT